MLETHEDKSQIIDKVSAETWTWLFVLIECVFIDALEASAMLMSVEEGSRT